MIVESEAVLVEPGAVRTGFANHEDEMLERYASQSELYRKSIGRVVAWHKALVEEGVQPEAIVETIQPPNTPSIGATLPPDGEAHRFPVFRRHARDVSRFGGLRGLVSTELFTGPSGVLPCRWNSGRRDGTLAG